MKTKEERYTKDVDKSNSNFNPIGGSWDWGIFYLSKDIQR